MANPIPPPPLRVYRSRLTKAMKALDPGGSVLVPKREAAALRSFGYSKGWRTVQRAEDGMVRVWRLEDEA